jgi:carbon-monoxide dehydrogenase iron sulfur subunit
MGESPAPMARLKVARGMSFAVPLQCLQCEDAPCVEICATKALHRADPNSPVVIEHELCIGCKCCLLACPFGVIRLDRQGRSIIKCDQCLDRVERGEQPACVSACPTGALGFRILEEILAEKQEAYLVQIERSRGGAQK